MKKIYIGEDQPLQLDLMLAALESRDDCQTLAFSDGLQLYWQVKDDAPDLLILDIIMPSLTGLAVACSLKFHEHHRGIAILVVSSITDRDIQARARKAGADVFLAKPFDVGHFLEVVDRLLNRSSD